MEIFDNTGHKEGCQQVGDRCGIQSEKRNIGCGIEDEKPQEPESAAENESSARTGSGSCGCSFSTKQRSR
ncbi:MAG: hypothetical protein LUF27_16515 [Lachnospiraceae bacterium]|nr:hypothetical protein [Lachnospiraceae bacterium]